MEGWKCAKTAKKVLLVEGKDDLHSIIHLCEASLSEKLFCIKDCDNDEGVLQQLSELVKKSPEQRPTIIGIVLDADKPEASPNLISRKQAIIDRLVKASPHYPSFEKIEIDRAGTIVPNPPEFPKVGFWFMPNNQDIGMLEDFLITTVKNKLKTEQCDYPASIAYAEICVQHAQQHNFTSFDPKHQSKAIVHTYLAWHEPPGQPLGLAIKAGNLASQTELTQRFIQWLQRLFV